MTGNAVNLQSKPRHSPVVSWQHFGPDITIFHPISKQYFILNSVAARIWELSTGNDSIQTLISTICDEFANAPQEIDRDVIETVEGLAKLGLLEV